MDKIIIIGGGAAGIAAAIAAAECGKKAVIYEKNEKLGKKLDITGKGRCNVTNNCDMDQLFAGVVTNKRFYTARSTALRIRILWSFWRMRAAV